MGSQDGVNDIYQLMGSNSKAQPAPTGMQPQTPTSSKSGGVMLDAKAHFKSKKSRKTKEFLRTIFKTKSGAQQASGQRPSISHISSDKNDIMSSMFANSPILVQTSEIPTAYFENHPSQQKSRSPVSAEEEDPP